MGNRFDFFKKSMCVLFTLLATIPVFSQNANNQFIYDRSGNKVVYSSVENVFHVGFLSGSPITEREILLADLSSIADYYMLPDSSYCFTVNAGYDAQFKTKAYANSYVAYCQNEYRDSLGGVVWGTNRIMVKIKPAYSIGTLLQILNTPNMQYESKWYDTAVFALVLPKDSNLFFFSNRIFESGMAEYVQPAFFRYVSLDESLSNSENCGQWNLKDTTLSYNGYDTTVILLGINAIRAWKFTSGDPDIRIAVLDDGVVGTHEDLSANFLVEKNYTGIDPTSMVNPREHGTKCAGVVSAANNSVGVIGVAYSCDIASFITYCDYYVERRNIPQPSSIRHRFSDELFEEEIHYACDSTNISIYSCSWHLTGVLSETFLSSIDYATQHGRHGKGCVFVFSSGNRDSDYETNLIRPTAALPNVLSVGATQQTGFRISPILPEGEGVYEWESCFGDSLDLMAPGYGVSATCYSSNDCYTDFEGTSAAAPHVAGVAALVLSIDTNLTYRQVFEILCSSAKKSKIGILWLFLSYTISLWYVEQRDGVWIGECPPCHSQNLVQGLLCNRHF